MDSFINIIVIHLGHASNYKELFYILEYHTLGDVRSIRNSRGFLFTISSHGANLDNSFMEILLHKSSVAFFIKFLMVKGYRFSRHIYAGNKIPSLAIDQSKNSISENFHKCGQCPQPDNPRPYKADERKSLVRIGCSGGQPNGSMLVCTTLGGFIGMKGLCILTQNNYERQNKGI